MCLSKFIREQSPEERLRASSANFYGRVSSRADRECRRTSPVHVDRYCNNVYVAAYKGSSRLPPWGGLLRYSHPTAARQRAAKEAWMSITPRHRIAALLGLC